MLVIGSIFVDVKGFARNRYMPMERNVGDVQVTAGGVCRNVAENLKTLGCEAEFVSMVDDNGMGAQVRGELAALGVNVKHVISAPQGMGMWLAILDEHGNLAGSISRQPDFSALEAYLKEKGDAIIAATDGLALEFDMTAEISGLVMALAKKPEASGIPAGHGLLYLQRDGSRQAVSGGPDRRDPGRDAEVASEKLGTGRHSRHGRHHGGPGRGVCGQYDR